MIDASMELVCLQTSASVASLLCLISASFADKCHSGFALMLNKCFFGTNL
jgi:hypothetical protein